MAENKTVATEADVQQFLDTIADSQKRADAEALVSLIREVTGEAPRMWGPSIIGFGSYHYKYDSGREGDSMLAGFSPRKQNLTLYSIIGVDGEEPLLEQLGKYTTGKGCLYIKKLQDIDVNILKELVRKS